MGTSESEVPLTIQALRIGDLGIAAIPCEVFAEIGLAIKAKSPLKPAFTIELANGYNGYLPTKEQHALGGYETWRARSSYLEVDAASKITATVLRLMEDLRARSTNPAGGIEIRGPGGSLRLFLGGPPDPGPRISNDPS